LITWDLGTTTVTSNRDSEIEMNTFNRMCSTIRRAHNNETGKHTQKELYKAVAVPTFIYMDNKFELYKKGSKS
jgi:hypothetical protein